MATNSPAQMLEDEHRVIAKVVGAAPVLADRLEAGQVVRPARGAPSNSVRGGVDEPCRIRIRSTGPLARVRSLRPVHVPVSRMECSTHDDSGQARL